jgi:hypothetical protein
MAWRRPRPSPLATMPAELRDYDPREWARPGEDPTGGWPGTANASPADYQRMEDRSRCHQRYSAALHAWFTAHPDADFIEWINTKRARRRV